MANHATFRSVVGKTALFKNNRTNTQRQVPKCTDTGFADDFLKETFTPCFADKMGILKNYRDMEEDFFTSLSNLNALHQLKTEDFSSYLFPKNIIAAYESAKNQLQDKQQKLGLLIVQNESSKAALATYKEYDIHNTFYYISVRPMLDLFKDKNKRKIVGMLMSVYAYLKKILQVPFFIFPNTYLYWVYDCLKEFAKQEKDSGEDGYCITCLAIFDKAEKKGRTFLKKITHPKHLEEFQKRIESFVPSNKMERGLWKTCNGFYQYKKYPNRNVTASIRNGFLEPQEEYRMYFQNYLSFAWDMNDIMTDNIIEHINTDLQDTAVIDQPMSMQVFDKPRRKIVHNLSFEKKLFKLIDELIYLLK